MGVDLKKSSFNIEEKLEKGKLDDNGIAIGIRLAKQLGVKLGDKLLLATKTSEGGLNGIKLPVTAVFKLGVSTFDKKVFFISLKQSKRLLKMSDGTTEILVFAKSAAIADTLKNPIVKLLNGAGISKSYKEQLGNLYQLLDIAKFAYAFIEIMIIFLASFVIVNTMMMAIFERMHEIGTLKALGFTNRQLFWNFTIEGGILGLLGGIPGSILGFIFIIIMSKVGINYEEATESIDWPIEYVIKPAVHLSDLFIAMGISVFVPILASMIPARYIKKLTAAEALRK